MHGFTTHTELCYTDSKQTSTKKSCLIVQAGFYQSLLRFRFCFLIISLQLLLSKVRNFCIIFPVMYEVKVYAGILGQGRIA